MKKTKKQKELPVVISTANLSDRKMDAIMNLCKTVNILANALNSTHTSVEIANCDFRGKTSGIEIRGDVPNT